MQINPKKFGKIAVLLGGKSSEREISLISGQAVLNSLVRQGFDAHALDVGDDVTQQLINGRFERAFNALHGPGGEDGVIQGALEILNIPYTGSGVGASALAMDKIRSKWIFRALGLATPDFMVIDKETSLDEIIKTLGLPLAIKPISQGSTLGVTRVDVKEQLAKAIELALSFNSGAMAEPWIEGKELTVGILNNEPLPVIHIVPKGFYDYENKYFTDSTEYHCPSGLNPKEEKQTQDLSLQAYHALGCRHWGRVDLMQDHNGKVWLLEVNTIPGLTDHSLVPKAAKNIGISFDELVVRILEQTL